MTDYNRKRVLDAIKYIRVEMDKGFYTPDKEHLEVVLYGAEASVNGNWFPIDTAPTETAILVYNKKAKLVPVLAGKLNKNRIGFVPFKSQSISTVNLTHWMPLPQPPKVKE